MTTQPEQVLENNLVSQLIGLGHKSVTIKTEDDLVNNLKTQLEKHNKTTFTTSEFERVLIHLSKGNIFDKAKTLRDKYVLLKDNGEKAYIEFINQDFWCQNEFQVTNQITINGKRENRYDVTILINGLPLIQIELKKRGIELKEAHKQVCRYQQESFASNNALFNYVQLFVISNGENTKYYANTFKQGKMPSYKFTSYWSDKTNKRITQIDKFANIFLEPCHIAKMITKYIVLHEKDKVLMVLRPYQFYAVESIIDRVKNSDKNGYIWHTTGSGKTLTSFKASQILTHNPKIKKVVFVVDRQDLDDQTVKEFRAFDKESIDGTEDTKTLVKHFLDPTRPLIVSTIQKLNVAIKKTAFKNQIEKIKDDKTIFIFDECHRSQFGETHKAIVNFFTNHQLFGFTGTPIFEENALSVKSIKQTTANLFHECLHKYVITDAIRDENVLKFSIEYYNVFKKKIQEEEDTKVEAIDTKEVYESDGYLETITNYILKNHYYKTNSKQFTAMFCVSSVDILIKYYELFKAKKEAGEHNYKIATIFSYAANPEAETIDGNIAEEEVTDDAPVNQSVRDKLDEFIADYNTMFNDAHSANDAKSFLNYKTNISKRVRNKEIDILLVVNMFLTGFDSKTLNTLYVDKNLKYHGLIQAYSRTNRILNDKKSQGNIVTFRNLKQNTDDAVRLFSNLSAKETITIAPYNEQLAFFEEAYAKLMALTPTPESVNELVTEEDELEFAKAFRNIMRLKNVLDSFTEFTFDDVPMSAQEFQNFSSKYLELNDKIRFNTQKQKVSILNEIDFEIELLHKDEINVTYIMQLLAQLKEAKPKDQAKQKKQILDLLAGESTLRSKRELIEQFIQDNLPKITNSEDIENEFKNYWQVATKKALKNLSATEALKEDKVEDIINDYLFTGRMATEDEVIDAMEKQPSVLQRESISIRIIEKIKDFVKTFINGVNN
ncbi:type I restriction endonuclease subunit R [Tenacibaculum maritimum]|nr:type I restriction endonuclease subunit R [Tenacibaculum maritimum]MDB0601589.1 type I restriction endonuclease subunit R [Tenacibaculum maritimum]MDB0612866.1 type I restriction endonuclease subunit R [Tenacibaculum maritimum]